MLDFSDEVKTIPSDTSPYLTGINRGGRLQLLCVLKFFKNFVVHTGGKTRHSPLRDLKTLYQVRATSKKGKKDAATQNSPHYPSPPFFATFFEGKQERTRRGIQTERRRSRCDIFFKKTRAGIPPYILPLPFVRYYLCPALTAATVL